jgi:Leucine-rich repeat (LRR) protein
MKEHALKIWDRSSENTHLGQFIRYQCPWNLISYKQSSSLFCEIIHKAHSLGGICPKKIPHPEELQALDVQIENSQDRALEKIWPTLCLAIIYANPEKNFTAPPPNASAIRKWLNEHQDLVQKVDFLTLSYNDLQLLPVEIGLFTSLQTLDVSQNQLKTLPSELRKITSLKQLIASLNELETLPSEIGCLTNLIKLDISFNKLKKIPPEIRGLIHLKYFFALNNQLLVLPPEMGQLESLEWLNVTNNPLKEFPAEIGQLKNLKILERSENYPLALSN